MLVDWSRNDPGRSTVAPWSARGQLTPPVSTPLAGDDDVAATGDALYLHFTLADVAGRIAQRGDLFAPVLTPP